MRDRRRRWRGGVATVVMAVLATGLAGLAPAAGADPVPVTLTPSVSAPSTSSSVRLSVRASVTTGPAATGVVIFSVGGVERGRAQLIPSGEVSSSAALYIEQPPGSGLTMTATFLGSAVHAPATASQAFTKVAPSATLARASGTMRFGATEIAIDPTVPFLERTTTAAYVPATGAISFRSAQAPSLVTVDLPGRGPTQLSIAPDLSVSGTVDADGSVVMSGLITLIERRILDDGIEWAAECRHQGLNITLRGQMDTAELTLSGSSPGFTPTILACDGRAATWDAALVGPIELDVTIPGAWGFVPTATVPTTTDLVVTGERDSLGRLTLSATAAGASGEALTGSVRFTIDGDDVGQRSLVGNAARVVLGVPLEAGPHTIEAQYTGSSTHLVSSDAVDVTIAPPPAGAPASATIGMGALAPFSAGAGVLASASIDPGAGTIAGARFWFPLTTFDLPAPLGTARITGRLIQTEPTDGTIDAANHVALSPTTFRFESYFLDHPFITSPLEDCTHAPITATLEGTASADGMHVEVTDATLPPLLATGCDGFADAVNARLGTTVDLSFDVAGDFRRTKVPTSMIAGSFLPTVAQGNQTVLAAAIDPDDETPVGGTITFADGATVLGTVPVSDGGAVLTATMNQPGTRTITATYTGDTLHDPATTTTTVEVTPAPEGFSLDGTIDVGGIDLDIATGSVLVPQTGAPADGAAAFGQAVTDPGARLWFAPTTITLNAGSYGPVTAEVRLTQNGNLDPATLDPDGRFQGLVGAFALQVRKVTLANGTTIVPAGCTNVVLLSIDGQVRLADAQLTSGGGGSGRYTQTTCTGVGRTVLNRLTNKTVALTATATL